MNSRLHKYITEIRKLTIKQAADQVGCSRQWLNSVVTGKKQAGRRLAKRIADWSGGFLTVESIMFP